MPQAVHDLSGRAPSALAEAVESYLEAVPTGRGFRFVADRAPTSAAVRLLASRSGAFFWSPVNCGPPAWTVEVGRPDFPFGDRFAPAIAYDHERLSALLAKVQDAGSADDSDGTRAALAALSLGFRRHVEVEERHLFPAFRFVAGVRFGPLVEVLLDQHGGLTRTLSEMESAADPARLADLAGHFRLGFDAHTDKEETSLLPLADDLLDAAARRSVLDAWILWTPEGERDRR